LYEYGSGSNLLSAVQVGWYAQGSGILNVPITELTDSSISIVIKTATAVFQTGSGVNRYYFTQSTIVPNANPPCFKEGTKILCIKDTKEVYVPIENIKKGDLVKTAENGPLKVTVVATTLFNNKKGSDRERNKLYKCSTENYSELIEDLYITGKHSILVNTMSLDEQDIMKKAYGRLYTTGKKFRLMAFIDERAQPCTEEGVYSIYHLALENDEICFNYGIYANGLLVESCNTKELLNTSGMRRYAF
jgi:hypothetical protein